MDNRLRTPSNNLSENAITRYRKKTVHVGFKLNIELSQKALDKYGSVSEINNKAKRLLLSDMDNKPDTWAELDKIVAEMDEKPRFEDFPRTQLGRELINFEEV